MENTKKITKVEYFGMLKAIVEASEVENKEELVAFVDAQVAQIQAKAEKAKIRAAEKKAQGDALRDAVQAVLTNEYQDIDTVMAAVGQEDVSRAKISARLTQLVKADLVEKEQMKNADGKKAMFYRLIEA